MRRFLWVFALCAISAFGFDVTGKWSGSFDITADGETKNDTAYLDLKQEGAKLTGSVGPSADHQFPIKVGSMTGNKIHLEVAPGGETDLMVFDLVVDGDQITGEAKAEHEGKKFLAKLNLKREK